MSAVDGTHEGVRRELAELRQRNAALQLEKQFLERIIDSITDPIFVKDADHRLVFVNDAECRLTGRARAQLLGKTDYDFFAKAEVDVFWEKDDWVLRTGEEDINEEDITDAQGAKRVIATKKTLHVDAEGRKFIVGIIRDITERKRAEDAVRFLADNLERKVQARTADLLASHRALEHDIRHRVAVEQALSAETERLKITLRSIADGVIATDVEGKLLIINRVAESLTEWTSEQATGQLLGHVLRLKDEKTLADVPISVEELLDGGWAGLSRPLLLLQPGGEERVVLVSAAPILDAESVALGVVVVFHDITERRLFEAHVADTQRLESLGVLAAGIAHDFNNLLSGIFGNIEAASFELPESNLARAPLQTATSLLERARALSLQLITFAKGGAPITRPVSLRRLLEESTAFFLSGSKVRSKLTIGPELRHCNLDENQIAQAINNVLLNAQQAMPDGGQVHIDASNFELTEGSALPLEPGDYVRICIRDSGIGMPGSVRDRVFDPFFTTKPHGSGLGLTMVFSIVRRHGGHLTLDSAPGAGTTVTLYLPAASAKHAQPEAAPSSARQSSPGRVLVVDDEPCIRDVLSRLLAALGWEVGTADSGGEALRVFHEAASGSRPFDLALIDLTIRGDIDGIETLRRLRELDPSLAAIASSGYADAAAIATPSSFGFDAALAKPYSLDQLNEALTSARSLQPHEARLGLQQCSALALGATDP